MKVYTCTDHEGYWPVGTASVIVANDESEARGLLTVALAERKLRADGFTLQLLNTDAPRAHVLRDGDY